MNWRHGFLRIWVVASVLWISGAAWYAIDRFSEHGFARSYLFVLEPDRYEEVNVFDLTYYQHEQVPVAEFPDGSRVYFHRETVEDPKPMARRFWDTRWSRYMRILAPLALIVFLPPLLAFFCGVVLSWIVRGFKAGATA